MRTTLQIKKNFIPTPVYSLPVAEKATPTALHQAEYFQNYNSSWGSFLGTSVIGVLIAIATDNPFLVAVPFVPYYFNNFNRIIDTKIEFLQENITKQLIVVDNGDLVVKTVMPNTMSASEFFNFVYNFFGSIVSVAGVVTGVIALAEGVDHLLDPKKKVFTTIDSILVVAALFKLGHLVTNDIIEIDYTTRYNAYDSTNIEHTNLFLETQQSNPELFA